jgi:hypothetical protein
MRLLSWHWLFSSGFSISNSNYFGRFSMKPTDWVKKYAAMDKRVELKYQHLPNGEQIGKRPEAPTPEAKKS